MINSNKNILQVIDFYNNNFLNDRLKIILSILQIYNCRIGEILSARWENFFPNRFLILPGSKGSSNIIIRDRQLLLEIFKLDSKHQVEIFYPTTYYSVYRAVKKYYSHLFLNVKHSKNLKVTHAFRYINVLDISDDKFVREILHHRSVRSNKYYTITNRKVTCYE